MFFSILFWWKASLQLDLTAPVFICRNNYFLDWCTFYNRDRFSKILLVQLLNYKICQLYNPVSFYMFIMILKTAGPSFYGIFLGYLVGEYTTHPRWPRLYPSGPPHIFLNTKINVVYFLYLSLVKCSLMQGPCP